MNVAHVRESSQAADDPAETNAFPMWQRLQSVREMQSGRGRFSPIDNARYPSVHPLDIHTFLSRAFAKR